jgi:hypothetical protein
LVGAGSAQAQEFSGTYVISSEDGTFTLIFEQDGTGALRGQMAMVGGGVLMSLEGGREDPGVSGRATAATGETYGFVAELDGQNSLLYLKLFPFDYAGNPAYDYAETLVFARQSAGGAEPAPTAQQAWAPGAATERSVYINRVKLESEFVQQMERQYQTRIVDGRYWYDVKCGAWGLEDGPTIGFIMANLDLPGPMPADISGGGTGIFFNGREIHVQDQMALQQIFGFTIPGRYWLDAQGNLGAEGSAMPMVNLGAAIQAAAGSQYGSVTGAGGTAASDGAGGYMFSGRDAGTGKSIFWYSGQ